MANSPRPWIVTPHGPIEKLDDNLWAVESPVPGIPGGGFPRRMSIVRRSDGTLLLHNAIPLDEAGLRALAALGRPELLALPSPFHCIDAHAMRAKLGLKVFAPAASAAQIGARVEVDGMLEALPPDPAVRFVPLAGVTGGEGTLVIESGAPSRTSLVLGDVLLNLPHIRGFWGLVWRLGGFTGGPRCGPAWLKRVVTDRRSLRDSLEQLAQTPGLHRLVPSHGEIIEREPAAVVQKVAAQL
jgi:hypothetical protein